MLVKDLMTKEVASVTSDVSLARAFQVLYEKKHSQLPVVLDGKLAGLITEKLLVELSPSKATSLSVFEINYLLSKTKVKDVMIKDVFTVSPSALVEDAAVIMYNNDIGSLPVIDEEKNLVGILTRLDIFGAFIEMMGVNDKGSRIALAVQDGIGVVADISTVIKDYGLNINHISNAGKEDWAEITIRLDTLEIDDLLKTLTEKGYKVLSVHKNE